MYHWRLARNVEAVGKDTPVTLRFVYCPDDAAWMKAGVERIARKTGIVVSPAELYAAAQAKTVWPFKACDNGEVVGGMVLTVSDETMPDNRVLKVWLVWGGIRPGYVEQGRAFLDEVAKRIGATLIREASVRKGWLKKLPPGSRAAWTIERKV